MTRKDDALDTHLNDIVLDTDSAELRAALAEAGIDATALVRQGRAAIDRALSDFDKLATHREGLRVLLQLLRRQASLTEEELARAADVDVDEIRRLEYDSNYAPLPRTVYQLEQHFRLPKRSLAKLAGITRESSPEFDEEVLRFAASAKSIGKLTAEEKKILNAFVRFLAADEQ